MFQNPHRTLHTYVTIFFKWNIIIQARYWIRMIPRYSIMCLKRVLYPKYNESNIKVILAALIFHRQLWCVPIRNFPKRETFFTGHFIMHHWLVTSPHTRVHWDWRWKTWDQNHWYKTHDPRRISSFCGNFVVAHSWLSYITFCEKWLLSQLL